MDSRGRAPVEAEAGGRMQPQTTTANRKPITNHQSVLTDPAVVVAVVLDVSAQGCDVDLDFLEDAPVAVAV
ncbi:MAG: hypothetical protein WAK31_20255 [Chthoniobacterales bacterium]